MSIWNMAKFWRGEEVPLPAAQPQKIRLPQCVKANMFLAVSGGLALLKEPKNMVFGMVTALFFKTVQSELILSQYKPLIDRFIQVIQPILNEPMTVADMIAFSALMMFDSFAPAATCWIGFTAALYFYPWENVGLQA